MLKRTVFAFALSALLAIGVVAHARDATIAGVVTRVEANRIDVSTDREERVTVGLTAATTYRKWIMAKPWQQDPRASLEMIRPGTRVRIEPSVGGQRQ